MKSVLTKLVMQDKHSEGFNMGTTILMILLFLFFIGSGFYLAITNY